MANPVITKVKVIKIAGLYKFWSSFNESFLKYVPITLPIPIFNIVLVPIGYSPIPILPIMLNMLEPIKAPARGAAGMPVLRAKAPKIPPAIR